MKGELNLNKLVSKITFIGDITCDRPLLNSAYINKKYDFSQVFSQVKYYFKESDHVIGNFETVCAGSKNNYQNQYMLCNSPDELIKEMSRGGITAVTTANNHCLDQGIEGIIRTIELLDKNNIYHTGTSKENNPNNRILYLDVLNRKIAIISNTYSTNASNTGIVLNETNDYYVNLLKEQKEISNNSVLKKIIFQIFSAKARRTINRIIARIKLKKGENFLKPRIDTILEGDTSNKYLELLKKDLKKAKSLADYVIVCPHIGGQFNTEPGEYCQFLTKFLLKNGADIIIGNHPHVAQNISLTNNKIIAYSLGSFNQSISADYIIHDSLPEYSIALHCYFSKEKEKISLSKITFSILKIIEDDNKMITVYPIDKLSQELNKEDKIKLIHEAKIIYERVVNKKDNKFQIKKEYILR